MIRAVLLTVLLWPGLVLGQSAEEIAAAEETYLPGLRFLDGDSTLETAGIRIVYVPKDVSPGNGRYFCASQLPPQRTKAATVVRNALARLGQDALERSDLKYILLCSEAKDSGRAIGGIPVPPLNLLMLSSGKNETPSARFGMTALHEFYHFIEFKNGLYNDPQWNNTFKGYMNSYGTTFPSAKVGSGGKNFINGYAQTFPHEDRAELFAIMVKDPGAVLEQLRKSNSPVLAQKIERVVSNCREMLGYEACR